MKGIIYELRYERTFMNVADTDMTRIMYNKKETAIRALKKKIEEWTKSKTFSTEDTLKVDQSDDTDIPAFYIEDGAGNSIAAKILRQSIETTY